MKELPLLRVSYNIRGAKLLDKNYVPCKTKAGQAWEPLHADNEYTLNVNLGYRNKDKVELLTTSFPDLKSHLNYIYIEC